MAMKTMRDKTYSKPVATTLVGCKLRSYTGKDGKQHSKGKGSFQLPNGDSISLEISRASVEKEEKTGVAYWVNVALFSNGGSNRR